MLLKAQKNKTLQILDFDIYFYLPILRKNERFSSKKQNLSFFVENICEFFVIAELWILFCRWSEKRVVCP